MNISVYQYSKQRNIPYSTVRKAVQDGRIFLEQDGKIDPVKADSDWEKNTALNVNSKKKSKLLVASDDNRNNVNQQNLQGDGLPSYQVSRARREFFSAKLAEIEVMEKAKKLVPVKSVEESAFMLARLVRDKLLAFPVRVAALVVGEVDLYNIEKIIDKEIRTILEEFSRA